jgi:hypothetical protein
MENWFKKHVDTVIVLGGILSAMIWMNAKFNGIDSKFSTIERDIAIIKTVLVMKGIMPDNLAIKEEK